MIIKTKIVATVGPASRDVPVLTRLVKAGVDVFRINFSHGTLDEHEQILKNIRRVSDDLGEPLAVMADLCGPKIRVGKMRNGGAMLAKGAEITIRRKPVEGTGEQISTTFPELIDKVRKGQKIRLDDGKIELEVVRSASQNAVLCRVVTGGILSSGKGVNLPKTNLSLSALTEKDRADAKWIARRDFDYVALSFVQRAADVKALRKILAGADSEARIIAKIEKPQAVKNIDAIIAAADGILVARGDMGVEMSLPEVPLVQKRLVRLCAGQGKVCIIATQMLETMTENPTPTRAEVSDVANAILDGTDAVMLSGETAVGKYPEKAVRMMGKIAQRTERYLDEVHTDRRMRRHFKWLLTELDDSTPGPKHKHKRHTDRISDDLLAIAKATQALVNSETVRAVVTFTLTGNTARILSKMRLPVPILALTPSERVMQQVCLCYGVHARRTGMFEHTREILPAAAKEVRRLRWARKGDKIAVVSGRPLRKPGTINTLVVHTL